VSPWETIFTSKYTLPSLISWESWKIILGYGFALFATTFTETAIALNVVDRLDESQGPGFLILIGQGVANIVSGVFGGMGGSGVVSMSVLADRTFGTTCLSTFLTGVMMFVFITWGYPVINFIPLSAISGISIAMVCSFIQWRSMVATFTTCLPSRKRDQLPPQYNIARVDVFIMLVVTAACLIFDVATLLFFVLGLAIFLYTSISARRERRNEKKLMESVEAGEVQFAHSGQLDNESMQDQETRSGGTTKGGTVQGSEQRNQQDEEMQQKSFSEIQSSPEEYPQAMDGNDGSYPTLDCQLMESAEQLIFPSSKAASQAGGGMK